MKTDGARDELFFEVRNLSKRFGPQYALGNVNIIFVPGRCMP